MQSALGIPAFGDFIVYVDEAGDHGPASPYFPMFVLAFCIFRKGAYTERVVPAIHTLKFRYAGHDALVLHEREIRKQEPPFGFLHDAAIRGPFMDDLGLLIGEAPFTLIAVVVDKRHPLDGANPYDVALEVGLVRVVEYLRSQGEQRLVHVVVESRGKVEDRELRAAFDGLARAAGRLHGAALELVFASKSHNHAGLQLADMVARPIGLHVLRPAQANRAYDVLAAKLWGAPSAVGRGLQLIPDDAR